MGTFHVTIEVGDPEGLRYQNTEALVDTGETYLGVPRKRDAFGCRAMERPPFILADDQTLEYAVGVVSVRLDGRTLPVLCAFGDGNSEPLRGVDALESFLLAPDPVKTSLNPAPGD